MVCGALNIPCLQFLKLLCLISTLYLMKSSNSETATVWTEQHARIQHIHTFSDYASDIICEPISSPLDNFCCCSVTSTVVSILYFIMAMFLYCIQEKILALHVSMKGHKNLTPVIAGGYFIVGMEQRSYHSNLQWQ